MINWITDKLPIPQSIKDEGNTYYLVKIKNYAPKLAMYLVNKKGKVGWYTSYISKLVKKVEAYTEL